MCLADMFMIPKNGEKCKGEAIKKGMNCVDFSNGGGR
jgi:hypothetical protein